MKEKLLALTIDGVGTIDAPTGIPSGSKYTLGSLASIGISTMMVFGIILALMYLIYGGFFWIQSKGDKEQLDKARRIIIYSIFGLILMSLALVVVNLIASAIGIDTTAIFGENQPAPSSP